MNENPRDSQVYCKTTNLKKKIANDLAVCKPKDITIIDCYYIRSAVYHFLLLDSCYNIYLAPFLRHYHYLSREAIFAQSRHTGSAMNSIIL